MLLNCYACSAEMVHFFYIVEKKILSGKYYYLIVFVPVFVLYGVIRVLNWKKNCIDQKRRETYKGKPLVVLTWF